MPIASLKKFDLENLTSGYYDWPATGISPDPDNHHYKISVLAWNIEGDLAYTHSSTFSIVEEVSSGGKGSRPITRCAININGTYIQLPGIQEDVLLNSPSYILLPLDIPLVSLFLSLEVMSGLGSVVDFEHLVLYSIDTPVGISVITWSDMLVLCDGNNSTVHLDPSKLGESEILEKIGVTTYKSNCVDFALMEGSNTCTISFDVPEPDPQSTRYYLLEYSGHIEHEHSEDAMPTKFMLEAPFPNPFNPSTTIKYHIPKTTVIELVVYDAAGKKIRTLYSGNANPGIHTTVWDGKNDSGRDIASGIYFYRLVAGDFVQTRKLVLLR